MTGSSTVQLVVLAAESSDQVASWWLWVSALVLAPLLIAFDLFVVGRIHPVLGDRAAAVWTLFWFALGLGYALLVWASAGETYAIKYTTGFLVEKALTIDQVFVIALLVKSWKTPDSLAGRVVFLSLWLGLLMRLPFIGLGNLMAENDSELFHLIMAALFVIGGIFLVRTRNEHAEPSRKPALRLAERFRPVLPEYVGKNLVVRRDGRKMFTLGAVVIIALLSADLYFAATVPLAFAFTKPAFIVLSSNIMALLGFRSLYGFAVSINLNVATLKVTVALVLWLVAVDQAAANRVHQPTWIVPTLVLAIVGAPMLWAWIRSRRPTREVDQEV
jgi:tellurite resistance protein TerC